MTTILTSKVLPAETVGQVQQFLVKGRYADMSISVIEGNTMFTIRCHRLVLASASPFLADLIRSSSSEDDDVSILLGCDTSNQELERLISYVYTGVTTFDRREERDSFLRLLAATGVQDDPAEQQIISKSRGEECKVVEETEEVTEEWTSWLLPHGEQQHEDQSCSSSSSSSSAYWSMEEEDEDHHLTTVDKSAILYSFGDNIHDNDESGGDVHSGDTIHEALIDLADELLLLQPPPSPQTTSTVTTTNSSSTFQCSSCPKHFPTRRYLRFHESSVHSTSSSSNRPLHCRTCSKSFTGEYYLRQHVRRMHSDTRPFACPRCPAAFSVRYDLVVHSRTHDAVKPFACGACAKQCATGRALREHERTHTGERPFGCGWPRCGKSFALPKTLRVHYRQHSGERPYLCPHCGRTFVQNSTLKNHLKSHEGVMKSERKKERALMGRN